MLRTPLNSEKRCLHPCRPCQSGAMPEFTAVHTLLVSAARCGIKQSVANVYIRPPNTDSQSRGSRLSIRPSRAPWCEARNGLCAVLLASRSRGWREEEYCQPPATLHPILGHFFLVLN